MLTTAGKLSVGCPDACPAAVPFQLISACFRWSLGSAFTPDSYVDEEVGTEAAAVDYLVTYAHGLNEVDIGAYPFQSENFGHTHNMGQYRSETASLSHITLRFTVRHTQA